ncbi:MAG TPA: ATP-grasp domain-containing protein [Phycisphaerae bacterium]|jgi:D-alanine-D-alanine ligase|nr:ATP-grasp domain-containing protein [Phycisphaerae bacterium]HOB75575.1 ATP-grasp domain-containing protein [Phycisphaerae bacterium]HOJ55155.1 ATP-grasp domain-containing protein [Phycisphaerae bacterium]HOL27357.1 ATP-grasp domain-containing protein [Phycisphaerae bacterium]HPP20703.1 ATP-grasp domain-containing protein [Phycisphaerae bacterium]
MKKLRVLALVHEDLVPPDSIEGLSDEQIAPFKTEYDVTATLHNMGHEVKTVGVSSDLRAIRTAVESMQPDIVFNLLEEFDGQAVFDQNVVSYLELLGLPYTGCGPRGLMLARDKALAKQILTYHRIRVPDFIVFPRGAAVRRPRRLTFPLFVKSRNEEASLGIAQASIVEDDDALRERVAFIHERIQTDAIVEQYIDGRELYASVVGNKRLRVFPIWELLFTKAPEDMPRIATARVKWDYKYQQRWGIISQAARDLPEGMAERIATLAKRIYRYLGLTGYARIDMRMTPTGELHVLEANPNPQLAYGEDFAESAHAAGVTYEDLLQRILNLGLSRARELRTSG